MAATETETPYQHVGSGSVWRLCLECGAVIRDLQAWRIHDGWHRGGGRAFGFDDVRRNRALVLIAPPTGKETDDA